MQKHMFAALLLFALAAQGAVEVKDSARAELPGSEYVVLRGSVVLPAQGYWDVASPSAEQGGAVQAYLMPPQTGAEALMGRRMGEVQRKRLVDRGRWPVQQCFWPCLQYAQKHNNTGPASLDDLDDKRYRLVRDNVKRSPWRAQANGKVDGPFVFLVPNAKFDFETQGRNRRVRPENRRVLAIELRPYIDDGKQWVLYTSGQCERQPIQQDVVKAHGLTIRPVLKGQTDAVKLPQTLAYTITVVRRRDANGPVKLTLRNAIEEKTLDVAWDVSKAAKNDDVLDTLKKARQIEWAPYVATAGSPVLASWMAHYRGAKTPPRQHTRRPRRSTTAFALLGGRAAMRETLQMEAIRTASRKDDARTVAIGSLAGVKVKSHPYEKMLAGKRGGELALANIAPADHFFVYVAKPAAVAPFLDKGAAFLAGAGAAATRSSIQYQLKKRYFARLGVTEEWVRMMLTSGAVKELAIIVPDLFFIDGTDVTAVVRLTQPKLVESMLKLVGVAGLAQQEMVGIDLPNGRKVHWSLRGDLLMISTSRSELAAVVALHKAGGAGSLGQSAEFRYMLTELAPNAQTRVFAYFSDPFIRRLVGPRMKIAQLRRLQARAAMEYLASCAMLAKLDGVKDTASIEALHAAGYVPERFLSEGYAMTGDLAVHSDTFGTLADMTTLSETPVEQVTQDEASAYKQYVQSYSRYWRQFFDPIAVRLDDAPGQTLELTTFILPLIDSSLYNSLREGLAHGKGSAKLNVPRIEPEPVLMVSLNLSEQAWKNVISDLGRMTSQYTSLSPAVFDDLGPAVHLALHDANPVIALGSGDALGVLGGDITRLGRSEMTVLPLAASLLTRPCSLIVETQKPERTRRFLRQAAHASLRSRRRDRNFGVDFVQIGDGDAWMFTVDIMHVIKLRYGIELHDNMIVIRNIPWSGQDKVVGTRQASLGAVNLRVSPRAYHVELPGLYAAAQSGYRAATMQGAACLYPLVLSGHAKLDAAAKEHARLFGFAPIHPGSGHWTWQNGDVVSSQYGAVQAPRQPSYQSGDRNFGLMKDIEWLDLSMQFEHEGLRAVARWKVR